MAYRLSNTNELVKSIFKDHNVAFASEITGWLNSSEHFRQFVIEYQGKIQKKVEETRNDPLQLNDLRFELEVGYLLLKNVDFPHVEYEKYGSGPDYTVACRNQIAFNVEVKHIQYSSLEDRLRKCEDKFRAEINTISSKFMVSLSYVGYLATKADDLIYRLEIATPAFLSFIRKTISELEVTATSDELHSYPAPGLENEWHILIDRLPETPPTNHAVFGTMASPIPFKLRYDKDNKIWEFAEPLKMSDVVCEALPQMRINEINVLFISTSSNTYRGADLTCAIDELLQHADKDDEDFFRHKKFLGVDDFRQKFKRVSAFVFRDRVPSATSRNSLLPNPHASRQIADDISDSLKNLD